MMTAKAFLCLLVFVSKYAFPPVESMKKTWKYSNDILNPINWESGKTKDDCNAVIFPNDLGSVASIYQLQAEEIVLPYEGELELRQGGFIEFTKNAPCIQIKELHHHHWSDPDSWIFEENSAIPDVEKIPCTHDDVVFPKNSTVATYYPEVSVYVNSIEIGGIRVTDEQWQNFLLTDYGSEQFYMLDDFQTDILVRPKRCSSKSGCSCHDVNTDTEYWVCDHVGKSKAAACLDPVLPVGHCNNICGGVILLKVNNNFALEDFKRKIPKHQEVDSYASKVFKNNDDYIQIIFVEKNGYNEVSTKLASDFHLSITNGLKSFGVNSAILQISGTAIPQGTQWATAMSIMLGTFIAVLIILIVFYIVYIGPLRDYNFSSTRIPFSEISFGNLRPFLFAKFENRDDGQLSMAASLVSLEKAFDNPMYGSHRPSTSSSAVDVAALTETQPTKSETIHENPAFNEAKSSLVEIEDIGEEEVEE